MFLFCVHNLFFPQYSVDVSKIIFKLCESNMDLGYDDNMLNIIGGSDETIESLGSLCGYDAALDPYCINLVNKPRKSCKHFLCFLF